MTPMNNTPTPRPRYAPNTQLRARFVRVCRELRADPTMAEAIEYIDRKIDAGFVVFELREQTDGVFLAFTDCTGERRPESWVKFTEDGHATGGNI